MRWKQSRSRTNAISSTTIGHSWLSIIWLEHPAERMADSKVEPVLHSQAEVGEGPAWNAEDQSLYWVDIGKSTINRFHPTSGKNTAWGLPSAPGCFVFRDNDGAIIAMREGIYD